MNRSCILKNVKLMKIFNLSFGNLVENYKFFNSSSLTSIKFNRFNIFVSYQFWIILKLLNIPICGISMENRKSLTCPSSLKTLHKKVYLKKRLAALLIWSFVKLWNSALYFPRVKDRIIDSTDNVVFVTIFHYPQLEGSTNMICRMEI